MRVMKNVGILCALALLLSLTALPAAALPNCSDCNCNTPCSTSCWAGPGILSACWSGPTCKEICEFEWLAPQGQEDSLEIFLTQLAAAPVEPAEQEENREGMDLKPAP